MSQRCLAAQSRRKLLRVTAGILFSILWSAPRAVLHAQSRVPYSVFETMQDKHVDEIQAKITSMIPSDVLNPSIVIHVLDNTPDISVFTPYRNPRVKYENDDETFFIKIEMSRPQMRGFLDDVGTEAGIADGGYDSGGPLVSFMLYSPSNGGQGFESTLNKSDSIVLFSKLRQSLASNESLMVAVDDLACRMSSSDPQTPTEVTSLLEIYIRGLKHAPSACNDIGQLVVKNVGRKAIRGPLSIVFSYRTCCYEIVGTRNVCLLDGVGYLNIEVPETGLPPGREVRRTLLIDNPGRVDVKIGFSAFSGPGTR